MHDGSKEAPYEDEEEADRECREDHRAEGEGDDAQHHRVAQRTAGLVKAGQVRKQRSLLTAEVRSGSVGLADVLAQADNGDPIAGRLKVTTLLKAVPGWGDKKTADAMAEIGIDARRRVGGLGTHQKAELIALTTPQR